jgi:hypothetical protein
VPKACAKIVSALRAGDVMYLLPDMNFGPEESIFVPFYGVQAATVPSLSRFARLGKAKVVPVVTKLTPTGYEVQVLEAWANFPTGDLEADTALDEQRLQGYIDGCRRSTTGCTSASRRGRRGSRGLLSRARSEHTLSFEERRQPLSDE